MSATRPTELPRFATALTAEVEEPSEAKKDMGWVAEKPPHETMNWLHQVVYDWIDYFDRQINKTLAALLKTMDFSDAGLNPAHYPTIYDAAWSPTLKLWCAVGYDSTSGSLVMTSKDGDKWTVRTAADADVDFRAITWGNGMFVAVGQKASPNINYVMTSTNGTSWTRRTTGITWTSGFSDIEWTGTNFVIVGNWEETTISANGTSWTEIGPTGGSSRVKWLAYSPELERLVAVGYLNGTNPGIRVSNDHGATWHTVTNAIVANQPVSIVWHSATQKFYALHTSGGIVLFSSPDGETWTVIPAPVSDSTAPYLEKLCVCDSLLIGINGYNQAEKQAYFVSSDGEQWTRQDWWAVFYDWQSTSTMLPINGMTSQFVAYNGKQFISFGLKNSPGYCMAAHTAQV
jgi:hypothetical protein